MFPYNYIYIIYIQTSLKKKSPCQNKKYNKRH